jgi:histidyl-tRNA synthetase
MRIERLPGMPDWLPPESERMMEVAKSFVCTVERAGYRPVVTPLLEATELFERSAGELADVSKEMYVFTDRGGREVAIRPEFTASVVRAFVEARPRAPFRAYYLGPAFRYERPQRGRYRQHHQAGVELIGSYSPHADAEVVSLAVSVLSVLGISGFSLHINSLGDDSCRPPYLEALGRHLEQRLHLVCARHKETALRNPLRILDCKAEECARALEGAPVIADFLCQGCRDHFAQLASDLEDLGIEHVVDPRLVRGFDYYTRTAFEIRSSAIGGAQNAIGGGGRYDGLVAQLGGDPTGAVGFGMGLERISLLLSDPAPPVPSLLVVNMVQDSWGVKLAYRLRASGLTAVTELSESSLRSVLRRANAEGFSYVVLRGERERDRGGFEVKDLGTGTQYFYADSEVERLVEAVKRGALEGPRSLP